MKHFRNSLGFRIYSILGVSFCGMIVLAVMQTNNGADSLVRRQII
jgi:hypothetical protein